jgi:hypothetical protein
VAQQAYACTQAEALLSGRGSYGPIELHAGLDECKICLRKSSGRRLASRSPHHFSMIDRCTSRCANRVMRASTPSQLYTASSLIMLVNHWIHSAQGLALPDPVGATQGFHFAKSDAARAREGNFGACRRAERSYDGSNESRSLLSLGYAAFGRYPTIRHPLSASFVFFIRRKALGGLYVHALFPGAKLLIPMDQRTHAY